MRNIRGQSTATVGAVSAKGAIVWDAVWCGGCGKFGNGSQFRDLGPEAVHVKLQYTETGRLMWLLIMVAHWKGSRRWWIALVVLVPYSQLRSSYVILVGGGAWIAVNVA